MNIIIRYRLGPFLPVHYVAEPIPVKRAELAKVFCTEAEALVEINARFNPNTALIVPIDIQLYNNGEFFKNVKQINP